MVMIESRQCCVASETSNFMAAYVFLGLNGRHVDATEPEIVAVLEGVAASSLTEAALAKWFRTRIQATAH